MFLLICPAHGGQNVRCTIMARAGEDKATILIPYNIDDKVFASADVGLLRLR